MTHAEAERSWEGGEPVEFYRFARGNNLWRYNTSDRTLPRTEGGGDFDYIKSAIRRERLQRGSESGQATLSIIVPRDIEVAELWLPYPSSVPVSLAIFRQNVGKTGSSMVWSGRVVSPVYTPAAVELKGEPTSSYAQKTGQVQSWQRTCGHVFGAQGDGLCNLNLEAHAVDATVSTVVANIVTSAGFNVFSTSNRLAGGYLKWTDVNGVQHRRSIAAHNGNTVTLLYGSSVLPAGTVVRAYPGCRHNWEDCEHYENTDNYGGEPQSPERSPFNGNPVF